MFIYGVAMAIVLFVAICTFMLFYNKMIISETDSRLNRDVYRVEANINSVIERINEYSKVMMFDDAVQSLLKDKEQTYTRAKMSSVYNIIGSTFIDTVCIYDFEGRKYSAESGAYRLESAKDISAASWYDEVIEKSGGLVMIKDDGGFLNDTGNHMIFLRVINDLDSLEPIGILEMTVPDSEFENAWSDVIHQYGTKVIIQDEVGKVIYESEEVDENLIEYANEEENTESGSMTTIDYNGQKYGVMHVTLSNNWKITQILSIYSVGQGMFKFIVVFFAVIAIVFIAMILINRYISGRFEKSVGRILTSIGEIKERKFNAITTQSVNREINQLQSGYNYLIGEIQSLIAEIEDDEKQKRTYELSLLQAQIRPHFLYNTFDAVSALAIMGRTDDIFTMMQALGKYYRFSLHKGDEVIPVADEVDIIKNYIIIMKYRFDGEFDVEYDIEDEAMYCVILKLTLQPFVENAIFHGMKYKKKGGIINIGIKTDGNSLLIEVKDNGAGMSPEQKEKMIDGKAESKDRGFGVRSTLERLRLYYGIEDFVDIESSEGEGTTIKLRIPALDY